MGYRLLPHTADVVVEAWAPTRMACLAEVVRGLVAVFADITGVVASRSAAFTLVVDLRRGDPGQQLLADPASSMVCRKASLVTTNPGGTGRSARSSSPRLAPLPPARPTSTLESPSNHATTVVPSRIRTASIPTRP